MKIVGVLGDSRKGYPELACALGAWLATKGVHLLTGGGQGVMEEVSRAFHQVRPRSGIVFGIIPQGSSSPYAPKQGYPNPWVEAPIYTHLHGKKFQDGGGGDDPIGSFSRNHINVLSASVLVALPGGQGTYSEIELAARYWKPLVVFLGASGSIGGLSHAQLTNSGYYVVEELPAVQRFLEHYV